MTHITKLEGRLPIEQIRKILAYPTNFPDKDDLCISFIDEDNIDLPVIK